MAAALKTIECATAPKDYNEVLCALYFAQQYNIVSSAWCGDGHALGF